MRLKDVGWIWEGQGLDPGVFPSIYGVGEGCDFFGLRRAVFPGKPIVMGCYLRDYPTVKPVPMELLKLQWYKLLNYLQDGKMMGYSILGTVLIDGQQEQADWIRNFIAEHS